MRARTEVTGEKLRGGYYTPPALVEFCLQRAAALVAGGDELKILEPSVGDGAFIRGIRHSATGLASRVEKIDALEIVPEEASKAEISLRASGFCGQVLRDSVLSWAATTDEWYGLLLGNPPFVRYQFVSDADKEAIPVIGERLGLTFAGVSNLWIPVLLGSLARLCPGGAFAVVLPTECFTGVSARVVREWLRHGADDLRFDLFSPGSFPEVLQEVAVLSGRRADEARTLAPLQIVEHGARGMSKSWTYRPVPDERNWTRSLLEPHHSEALSTALASSNVVRLDTVARLEVSIVTGANDFFCVDDATVRHFHLEPWARPLLARARHSPGLNFTPQDLESARREGVTTWLLDFDPARPDPTTFPAAREYLESGISRQLPGRYKCRIRDPWYRVPFVRSGALMLSKRSHLFPRLLLNGAEAFTTDTIYRGDVLPGSSVAAADLVTTFHSSLTLLLAELEGRSFGGGVLELVPSEIARLSVVALPGFGKHLACLDAVARADHAESLVDATDRLLASQRVLPADLLSVLSEARGELVERRLRRNAAVDTASSVWTARIAA